jgi:hypothetical protein
MSPGKKESGPKCFRGRSKEVELSTQQAGKTERRGRLSRRRSGLVPPTYRTKYTMPGTKVQSKSRSHTNLIHSPPEFPQSFRFLLPGRVAEPLQYEGRLHLLAFPFGSTVGCRVQEGSILRRDFRSPSCLASGACLSLKTRKGCLLWEHPTERSRARCLGRLSLVRSARIVENGLTRPPASTRSVRNRTPRSKCCRRRKSRVGQARRAAGPP